LRSSFLLLPRSLPPLPLTLAAFSAQVSDRFPFLLSPSLSPLAHV
jgi:hypothetical protein